MTDLLIAILEHPFTSLGVLAALCLVIDIISETWKEKY
jgi:hypothetical protein